MLNMVALIPARAGSKRVPGKCFRRLNGRALVDYSVFAAAASGVFSDVIIATDAGVEWGGPPGARIIRREPVPDDQPDIVWVREVLSQIDRPEAFAILRPTSPFRTAATIQRAYRQFTLPDQTCDSLRAVETVRQHPYKMWVSPSYCPEGFARSYPIKPLIEGKHPDGTPWHSSPTQTLPEVYVQTSALEMAWTRCVEVHGTISGRKVAPFFGSDIESISIDTEAEWRMVEDIARRFPHWLPTVDLAGVPAAAPAQ